jgi:acyl dehydratase
MLLSLVMQTVAEDPSWVRLLGRTPRITSAKFLAPVRPGDMLRLALQAQSGRLSFTLHAGDTLAASGLLEPAAGAVPAPASGA